MVMTEENFSELVTFIDTHPEWRHRLVKALFPDLDIPKAFQELAEAQRQMQQLLQKMAERIEHLESDVSILKSDVSILKGDMATVKGFNYESRIIQRADAIFGRFMRRGHEAKNEIGLLLEEAEENGLITEAEHDHVLALDLLWRGKQKGTKADMVLAIEVSWRVEESDLQRAISRAETIRKVGLVALPVVAGLIWEETIRALAYDRQVVIVTEMTVEADSWQNAG